jgi:hypothetical protein
MQRGPLMQHACCSVGQGVGMTQQQQQLKAEGHVPHVFTGQPPCFHNNQLSGRVCAVCALACCTKAVLSVQHICV